MLAAPERLRRVMRARGDLTQASLAEMAGVSQPTVSNLVTGTSLDGVSAAAVARICKAVNVSIDYLLLGKGDVIPELVSVAKNGGVGVLDESETEIVPPLTPARPRKRHRRRA